jgi:DNA repair ATPase RecN
MTLVLGWLKNNWSTLLVFVLVLSVSLWVKNKFDEDNLQEVQQKYVQQLADQRKAYDSQIEQINKINTESLEKQKALLEDYKQHLDSLQSDYDQKVKELEDLRQAKIVELAKKIKQDPETVLEDVAHKFGFEIVPAGDRDE